MFVAELSAPIQTHQTNTEEGAQGSISLNNNTSLFNNMPPYHRLNAGTEFNLDAGLIPVC